MTTTVLLCWLVPKGYLVGSMFSVLSKLASRWDRVFTGYFRKNRTKTDGWGRALADQNIQQV
jgi:hypothetical protein